MSESHESLSLFAARDRVLAAVAPSGRRERVALADARGRRLAEVVASATPWPVTDRAAMDGFALNAGPDGLPAGARLPVVGESLAGRPFAGGLPSGAAIRIMTGAVVPAGADTVVAVEATSGFGGDAVTFSAAVVAEQNIRRKGSELAAGATVLAPGRLLCAAEIGVLAVLGRTTVEVAVRPRVAIVATGDEVVPIDAIPLAHQVRESNSWALAAQVAECGGEPLRLGIAPDEPAALRAALARGLDAADVLLTIGGVSKGTHDLVHATLAELGVEAEFHGLQLKPGKPTFFGVREHGGRRQYVFGLPGNPASTFTVFDLLVRPLLVAWLGGDPGEWGVSVPLGDVGWRPNRRLQAVPAELRAGAHGQLVAQLAKPTPSGDPFGLCGGACYALVPPGQRPGEVTTVQLVGGSSGIVLP